MKTATRQKFRRISTATFSIHPHFRVEMACLRSFVVTGRVCRICTVRYRPTYSTHKNGTSAQSTYLSKLDRVTRAPKGQKQMIRFILAVILLLVALSALVVKRSRRANITTLESKISESDRYENERLRRELDSLKASSSYTGMIAAAALVVGLLFGVWSFIRIVPANNVGIPTTFGKPGSPITQGIHVVLPWTSVHNLPTRVQSSERLFDETEGDKAKRDCVEVKAKDGSPMCVDITTRYTVNPASAYNLWKRYGDFDTIRTTLIRREVEEGAKLVYGKYSPEESIAGDKAGSITEEVRASISGRFEPYGITIDGVNIGDIHLDPAIQGRINEKIASRQAAEKALIDQQKTLTEAETQQKKAEIDKTAAITAAEADAEKIKIKAQAEAEATTIAAEAEAKANSLIADSVTQDLIELRRAEALSKADTIYVPSDSTLLIGTKP